MTTREPGASEVFTHGLTARPRSTAFRANKPAAIITAGFEVLVQLVMAAITTCPWSIAHAVPSASVTGIGFEIRVPSWFGSAAGTGLTKRVLGSSSGGSLAGNESAEARSMKPVNFGAADDPGEFGRSAGNAARYARPALRRATRSCGRVGPAMLGSIVARSSSRCSAYAGSACGIVPETLSLCVCIDQRDALLTASGEAQVPQRFVVDREDRDRRPVLG